VKLVGSGRYHTQAVKTLANKTQIRWKMVGFPEVEVFARDRNRPTDELPETRQESGVELERDRLSTIATSSNCS
jgi:hypothetical protein